MPRILLPANLLRIILSIVNAWVKLSFTFLFERNVSLTLRDQHGGTFLDIGANNGYYCCLLNRNFRNLIAVEPEPTNVRLMRLVFRLGRVKATMLPYAVADKDGMTLLLYAQNIAGHQVSLGTTSQTSSRGARKVRSVTVDRLVREYGDLDLVKVDVEGAEWLVLAGSENVVHKIGAWMIELHDPVRRGELEGWMAQRGYKYRWLDLNHIFARRDSSCLGFS